MQVHEVMQPEVRSVRSDLAAADALFIMVDGGFRHLPVVDGDHHVIGMLSDRDLSSLKVELVEPCGPCAIATRRQAVLVKDVMSWHPLVMSADADVLSLVTLIVENRLSAVPITKGRRLVGIVSYLDLMQEMRRMLIREVIPS